MVLVRIHRDVKGSARYIEEAVDRITAMSERHGGDAAWLGQTVWTMYAQRSPFLGLWVLVDDYDAVKGHLVATVQQWDGGNVAWIHQAENDGSPMSAELWEHCMNTLTEWARDVNVALSKESAAPVRRFLFSTPHNPKFFERRAGFHVYRHLLERPIRG